MVVAEHEHQRKMFGALQMHLQEAIGNPFVQCHVSLLSQNSQSTMCFTSIFKLCAYKLQLLHEVKPDDKPKRATFEADILQRVETDNFLAKVLFSDEATFHLLGYVKNIVYATRVTSVEQFCERIYGAIETVMPQMLEATW
jgi:hypothetical protein